MRKNQIGKISSITSTPSFYLVYLVIFGVFANLHHSKFIGATFLIDKVLVMKKIGLLVQYNASSS